MQPSANRVFWILIILNVIQLSYIVLSLTGVFSLQQPPPTIKLTPSPTSRELMLALQAYTQAAQQSEWISRVVLSVFPILATFFTIVLAVINWLGYSRLAEVDSRLREADDLSDRIRERTKDVSQENQIRFRTEITDPASPQPATPLNVWQIKQLEAYDFWFRLTDFLRFEVDARFANFLGNYWFEKQAYGEAALRYRTAIGVTRNEHDKSAYQYNLAKALARLAQSETDKQACRGILLEAQRYCESVIARGNAILPSALFQKAWILDEMARRGETEKFNEAKVFLEKALQEATRTGNSEVSDDATYNLACVKAKLGDDNAAIQLLKSIKDKPWVRPQMSGDDDVKQLVDKVFG